MKKKSNAVEYKLSIEIVGSSSGVLKIRSIIEFLLTYIRSCEKDLDIKLTGYAAGNNL